MADEYSEQKFHEKKKTELKAGTDASSDDSDENPNSQPISPFARPSESSPYAPPEKDSNAGWPTNNNLHSKGPANDSNTVWPSNAPAKSESPYAKVYEDTPYGRLIERVTGESPRPASIENLLLNSAKNEPPDLGHDQYKILDIIGQGGMGTVYRVQDVKLEKEVAIKCIRPELATDQTALKRFYQECEALAQLNHPHIVAIYALRTTASGAPYLVMDYIAGESLGAAINKLGRLDADRAMSIFSDICEALHYAHGRGVIHRDLKPNNILLSASGAAQVVDFGIAKVASKASGETVTGLTQMGDMFGTPAYMSPEQCEGEPLDVRSDIYSFGCVMYETLSGSPPFSEANPFKLMTKHVNEKAPSLEHEGINRSLSNIVAKCLEKRPENRYQTVDQLLQDIAAVRNSKEPLNVRQKASPKIPRVKLTPSIILKTVAVISAMVAVGFTTFMISRSPSIDFGVPLTTGGASEAPIEVPMISVTSKPKVEKPVLIKPEAFKAAPYVPLTAAPLTEKQKESYRMLLHEVTPISRPTLEPLLKLGKSIAPFLLEEIKNPDQTIARGSSIILIELGPSVMPGLIEDFKVDSNHWIKDAIEGMGNNAIAPLSPLLTDDDPQIRTRAVATIRDVIQDNILPVKLNNMILWLALNDNEAMVREAACAALSQSPMNENVSRVLSYNAINDTSLMVRTRAIRSLGSVASREGDTSKGTLDVFGWVIQNEATDTIKQMALQNSYVRDYGESLAPYLRSAYYKGSKNIQSIIVGLSRDNQSIADALLPELIDHVSKEPDNGRSTLVLLKSMKGRAKAAIPALVDTLKRMEVEHPMETFRHRELKEAIEAISRD